MILEKLMLFWQIAIFTIFDFLQLPEFPTALTDALDSFLDFVFSNLSVLGFFVRPTTLAVVIPVALVIITIDKIYDLIMFILRKIPFIGVN